MSRLIDFVAESSNAGDSMWRVVPALTASASIVAAACTIAVLPMTIADFGILPSRSRCFSASAPLFPSMQTHAISSRLRSSMSDMPTVPPSAPMRS